MAWRWQPDLVVGDMDSIEQTVAKAFRDQGVPFEPHPREKDQTDLELAIGHALDRDAHEIIIAGALGARIDHTLGNLALLALPALAAVRASLVDDSQTIWLVRDHLQIEGKPGDLLSLIPFGGNAHGVCVRGVHWTLDQAELPLGPSLGISNRLTDRRAEVRISTGMVLVVHTRAEAVAQERRHTSGAASRDGVLQVEMLPANSSTASVEGDSLASPKE
jgi:thiamine pyrophosphokinase